MNTLVLLCLLLFPVQQQIKPLPQPDDPDIAIVMADRVYIIKKSVAERRLSTTGDNNRALKAALEIALGTAITNEVDKESLTVQEVERFRWHRRALQWRKQ